MRLVDQCRFPLLMMVAFVPLYFATIAHGSWESIAVGNSISPIEKGKEASMEKLLYANPNQAVSTISYGTFQVHVTPTANFTSYVESLGSIDISRGRYFK